MKNTANPNIQHIILDLIEKCTYKKTKRGLKILNKHVDMSYMFTLPMLAYEFIRHNMVIEPSKKELNILVHAVIKKDCVDYFRWFAVLPILLGRPDLKVNVIAMVEDVAFDTQTKYRNVIDQIILTELGDNFTSQLVNGSLSDVVNHYGESYFDFVLNNLPEVNDLESNDDIETLHKLISLAIPYVISDFSKITMLYRYSVMSAYGLKTDKPIFQNKNSIKFGRISSVTYQHAGYFLVLNDLSEECAQLDALSRLKVLEKAIVSRMNEGDLMLNLPKKEEDRIILFEGVELCPKENEVFLRYKLFNYRVQIPSTVIKNVEFIDQFSAQDSTLQDQAHLVNHILTLYLAIVMKIENKLTKKGEAA
jgi:hypothetical protein